MSDLISRQQAISAVVGCTNCGTEDVLRAYVTKHSLENGWTGGIVDALDAIEQLPSIQPEQTKMIKEIREWINSGNRGSADYFIVDKIEEILNKYE